VIIFVAGIGVVVGEVVLIDNPIGDAVVICIRTEEGMV
jgi:hypothetical protein